MVSKKKIAQLQWIRDSIKQFAEKLDPGRAKRIKPLYDVTEAVVKIIVEENPKKIIAHKADLVIALDKYHLGHFVQDQIKKEDIKKLQKEIDDRYAILKRQNPQDKDLIAVLKRDEGFRVALFSYAALYLVHLAVGYLCIAYEDKSDFIHKLSLFHDSIPMKIALYALFSAAAYNFGKVGAQFAKDNPDQFKKIAGIAGTKMGIFFLGAASVLLWGITKQETLHLTKMFDFLGTGSPEPELNVVVSGVYLALQGIYTKYIAKLK